MKLFSVDFKPMYGVPYGLIIQAENSKNAKRIAQETITHTKEIGEIKEIDLEGEGVVFYKSGDY